MKKTALKIMSAISASLLLLSSISVTASANASPDLDIIDFAANKTAIYTSMGFNEEQIRNIETASMAPTRYLAYYNFPANITLSSNSFFQFTNLLPIGYSFSSSDIIRGSGVSSYAAGYLYVNIGSSYNHLLTYHTFTNTDADFPNICRIKLTTNNVQFAAPMTNTGYEGALTYGVAEAGNITKYITGSTDNASLLTEDDAQRLLLHAAYVMSEIDDPNWTDKATVAGDLNFDNQITAADSQILLNALANGTDLW